MPGMKEGGWNKSIQVTYLMMNIYYVSFMT